MKPEAKWNLILIIIAIILTIFLFYSLFQMISYEKDTFEKNFWTFNIVTITLIMVGIFIIGYFILRKFSVPPAKEKIIKVKARWGKIKILCIILTILGISFQGSSLVSMFYIGVFLGFDAVQEDIHSIFFYLGLGMEFIMILLVSVFFMRKKRN